MAITKSSAGFSVPRSSFLLGQRPDCQFSHLHQTHQLPTGKTCLHIISSPLCSLLLSLIPSSHLCFSSSPKLTKKKIVITILMQERHKQRQTDRWKDRANCLCWFTPQMPAMARTGPGPEQEARNAIQVFHMGGRNPIAWAVTTTSLSLHWQELTQKLELGIKPKHSAVGRLHRNCEAQCLLSSPILLSKCSFCDLSSFSHCFWQGHGMGQATQATGRDPVSFCFLV